MAGSAPRHQRLHERVSSAARRGARRQRPERRLTRWSGLAGGPRLRLGRVAVRSLRRRLWRKELVDRRGGECTLQPAVQRSSIGAQSDSTLLLAGGHETSLAQDHEDGLGLAFSLAFIVESTLCFAEELSELRSHGLYLSHRRAQGILEQAQV